MIKRLILVGFFSGELNREKRDFFLKGIAQQKNFDHILFLTPHPRKDHEINPHQKIPYPLWLSHHFYGFSSLIIGLLRFVVDWITQPHFIQEIVSLEISAFSPKNHSIIGKFRERTTALILFFSGLGQITKAFKQTRFNDHDTIILWSEHMTGMRLLKKKLTKTGIKFIYSEYGELPQTIFACNLGMFHDSWPSKAIEQFNKLPLNDADLEIAKTTITQIIENRTSSKSGQYSKNHEIGFMIQTSTPVIYINGIQEHASGLLPRCSAFSKIYSPAFATNDEILTYFSALGKKNGWNILYKDHPNTCNFYPAQRISAKHREKHVKVLENVDIYEVLDISDLTISLGSKTVLLSLLSGVPVCLLGPYSISSHHLRYGLLSGQDYEANILKLISPPATRRVDNEALLDYTARLIKYYYYSLNIDEPSPSARDWSQFSTDLNEFAAGRRPVLSSDLIYP